MIRSNNDSCKNNTELHAKYLKLRKYPYSVRMPENAEQKSSEYGDFLRSDNPDENAIKTSFYWKSNMKILAHFQSLNIEA